MSDHVKQLLEGISTVRRGLIQGEPVEIDELHEGLIEILNNIEHAVVLIRIVGATPEQTHEVKMRIARSLGAMRRRQIDTFRQLEKTLAAARALSYDSDEGVDVTDTMERYEAMLREQTIDALNMFERILVGDPTETQ